MTKATKANQPKATAATMTTQELIAKFEGLPLIQTKHLTQLFGFNDGGKFLRRHLRKHFRDEHLWGDSWVWKSTDKQLVEIIEYFTDTIEVFNENKRLLTDSLVNTHDVTSIIIK